MRNKHNAALQDVYRGHYDEIKAGDTILLDYGCGCGSDTGKAYGKRIDRWGRHIRVKLEDGTFQEISSICGAFGEHHGVGAYWRPDSPLRLTPTST
jgi:hypothetical protein